MNRKFLLQTISIITFLTPLSLSAMDDPGETTPLTKTNVLAPKVEEDLREVQMLNQHLCYSNLPLKIAVGNFNDSSWAGDKILSPLHRAALNVVTSRGKPTSSVEEFLNKSIPQTQQTYAQLLCNAWNWAFQQKITPKPGEPMMNANIHEKLNDFDKPEWNYRHPYRKAWYLSELKKDYACCLSCLVCYCPSCFSHKDTVYEVSEIPEDTSVELYSTFNVNQRSLQGISPILTLRYADAKILMNLEEDLLKPAHLVKSDLTAIRHLQGVVDEKALDEAITKGYIQDENIRNYKTRYKTFEAFKDAYKQYQNVVDVLEDGTCLDRNYEPIKNLKSPLAKHAALKSK